MNGKEIRDLINFNNKKIEELLDPATFVLQPEVQVLLKENDELRAQCSHEFENGICIYCGLSEDSLK